MKIDVTLIRVLLQASGYYTALVNQVENQTTIPITSPRYKQNTDFITQLSQFPAMSYLVAFLMESIKIVQGENEMDSDETMALITIVIATLKNPETMTDFQKTTTVIYSMFCAANRLDYDTKIEVSGKDHIEVEISEKDFSTLTTSFY